MLVSEAKVKTEKASRYIAQLCKHFQHKVPAEYDEREGRVDFQPGNCVMTAADGVLTMRCEADDEKAMGRVKYILDDHLTRFAWREKPEIVWENVA